MNTIEAFSTLDQTLGTLESQLQRETPGDIQPSLIAGFLRDVWPDARIVCALQQVGNDRRVCLLDGNRRNLQDLELSLRGPSSEEPVQSCHRQLANSGTPLLVSEGPFLLALVLDRDVHEEEVALARLGLGAFLRLLTNHELKSRCRAQAGLIQNLEPLANAGELAGVVAHEMTNFLNMFLLQVTILELRLPAEEQEDLGTIRRGGNAASELVNRFQNYRRGVKKESTRVDLAAVVREVVGQLVEEFQESFSVGIGTAPEKGVVVTLETAVPGLWVPGHASEVRRLTRFLVGNSLRACSRSGGKVVVHVEAGDAGPRLRVEDTAPLQDSASAPLVFDLTTPPRDGVDNLELAACRSLARRLRCELQATKSSTGGLQVLVDFQAVVQE